jgi:hypothetical protein
MPQSEVEAGRHIKIAALLAIDEGVMGITLPTRFFGYSNIVTRHEKRNERLLDHAACAALPMRNSCSDFSRSLSVRCPAQYGSSGGCDEVQGDLQCLRWGSAH